MEKRFGLCRYWTTYFEDKKDGFGGLRLHREDRFGEVTTAAEMIYWDAMGSYSIQTFNRDAPLSIIECLIAEGKSEINKAK
jgi:hypothetical protein